MRIALDRISLGTDFCTTSAPLYMQVDWVSMVIGVIRFNGNAIFLYRQFFITSGVVYQNTTITNIISMKFINPEVICCLWTFKQFVLNLFDNDILAIEHDEDITCSEINCACPPLNRRIERMHRRTGDLFPVHLYMNPFLSLIPEDLNNFLECGLAGFFIGCPYEVTGLDVFNRYKPGFGCHQRPCYETLDLTKLLSDKLHSARHNAACNTYLKCFLKRRIPTVSNLFGSSISSRANRSLDNTRQKRCCQISIAGSFKLLLKY